MSTNRLIEYKTQLENSLEKNNYKNCKLMFSDEEFKSEGFIADVQLARMTWENEKGEKESTDVFLKYGKDAEVMKIMIHAKVAYENEAYAYSTLFPTLFEFVNERNRESYFDNIPKCFGTFNIENIPVIVLENLKTQSYRLNDMLQPMSLAHMKLVYEVYAKLHATSLALKDQKPEEYVKLTERLPNTGDEFWLQKNFRQAYEVHNRKTFELLEDDLGQNNEVCEKWKKVLAKGTMQIFEEMVGMEIAETVITHSDCWNNNFMFQYQPDEMTPIKVKLVDFQTIRLHSPVIDLCSYFYSTCYSKTAQHFDELIEHYYKIFAKHLKEMGSDAENIFSFSTLKRHWRDYSLYGSLRAWQAMHVLLCDKDDIVRFEDLDEPSGIFDKKEYKINDMDMYKDRLLTVIKHYCDYQLKYYNI